MKTSYLVLENGKVFKGYSFGAEKETVGEVVFTTSMTGYNEIIADPAYFGQIVIQTFPLMGNYGTIDEDIEGKTPVLKGYVAKTVCDEPSNFRCDRKLEDYLIDSGIVGLCGIDTRALTRVLSSEGTMNGKITADISDIEKIKAELKAYKIENAVSSVCENVTETYKAIEAKCKVVLWDMGAKYNLPQELAKRGCDVTVVPYNTTADEILAMSPDGVVISNGPGDPAENVEIIAEIKKLCDSKTPMFGICLGHQLLALAKGAKTEKLNHGHRGGNHPVKDAETGNVYITSQNHSYAVVCDSLPEGAKCSFVNINDHTCEGVEYTDIPAFSVQFIPDFSEGARRTSFLFDKFIDIMGGVK